MLYVYNRNFINFHRTSYPASNKNFNGKKIRKEESLTRNAKSIETAWNPNCIFLCIFPIQISIKIHER